MIQAKRILKAVSSFVAFVEKICLISAVMLLSHLPAGIAAAQDISATTLADYGNVSVLEVSGGFDARNPDGSVNSAAREAVAREFLKTHKDEYDFLVFFSNFDYVMPSEGTAKAFYLGAKNDTHGIGKELFDNSAAFGSNGRLQGTIDLGNLASVVSDPLDPKFNETLYVLSHELMHRWAAKATFRDVNGNISQSLLGKDQDHWSFLLDSRGSVMYGNQWQDNGNGTFTSTTSQREMKYYSPLDRYLAGMIDKSKVPPMLLIESPETDPERLPEAGATVTGSARVITIDDIIASLGSRVPDAASAPKTFKTAFLYLTRPGTFAAQDIYAIENIRNGFVTRHSILTDGASIVEASVQPKENLPVNPGKLPPPAAPRSTPASLDEAVAWLVANQQQDGSWRDLVQTAERDTAAAVAVLQSFPGTQTAVQAGFLWMSSAQITNTDFLCRRIEAGIVAGQDGTALIQELVSRKNSDNGWGSERTYGSNAADTALVLKTLAAAGYEDPQVVSQAIQYLKDKQKQDGGWTGNGESTIQATVNVLSAFSRLKTAYQLDDQITKGVAWLVSKQNSDGGFGSSSSTVYDTASAMLALFDASAAGTATANALQFLLSRQDQNGSWSQSAFETSLAAAAMLKALVDPELSIKASDITFIPGALKSLPSPVVVNAAVENLGRTGAQAKVALYDGDPLSGTLIGEQTLMFPGQSSTVVAFQSEVRDGSERRYTVVVDPDNAVKESNEANNTAWRTLQTEATYDFEILATDIGVAPSTVNQYQDMNITVTVRNKGTVTGYSVPVRVFIDDSANPMEIATLTIDSIPSGGSVTRKILWRAAKAGANQSLAVQIDPFNTFMEVSKENNTATAPVTVNAVAVTDPNITVSYRDIVVNPSPVNQGGAAALSAVVKNEGAATATNIAVAFYRGVPETDSLLLGTTVIPSLAPGESVTVTAEWSAIGESGEKIIFVQADYAGAEIRKNDNSAFTTLNVLSYPDLVLNDDAIAVTPATPKENEQTTVYVTVRNQGDQAARDVRVTLSEGSAVINSTIIPLLSGHDQSVLAFAYDTAGKIGSHIAIAIVDPENRVLEQEEGNNTAERAFSVSNANQWVSEEYFSPNGDGVKDTTEIFFRLEAPATVSISLVNAKGDSVRTFRGGLLANTTGGSIVWDGLDDAGKVVEDGRYSVAVRGASGMLQSGSPVIVDTNRSPLIAAVGTKYLMKNDMECRHFNVDDGSVLAYLGGRDPYACNTTSYWLPDDSGIILGRSCSLGSANDQGPAGGVFILSPDGDSLEEIATGQWGPGMYLYYMQPSPDGTKAVVRVGNDWKTELWLLDIASRHMVRLDSRDVLADHSYIPAWSSEKVQIAPDNAHVSYLVTRWTEDFWGNATYVDELWTSDAEGTVTSKILETVGYWNYNQTSIWHVWSPDGRQIYYLDGTNGSRTGVWVADPPGTQKKNILSDLSANFFSVNENSFAWKWIDDKHVLAVGSSIYQRYENKPNVNVVNVETGERLPLGTMEATTAGYYSVASGTSKIAFRGKDTAGNKGVVLYDVGGYPTTVKNVDGWQVRLSPDGRWVAVRTSKANPGFQYASDQYLTVIDTASTNTVREVKLLDAGSFYPFWSGSMDGKIQEDLEWFDDNRHVKVNLSRLENIYGNGFYDAYAVDVVSGERSLLDDWYYLSWATLSPKKTHLTAMQWSLGCAREDVAGIFGEDGYPTHYPQGRKHRWSIGSALNLTAALKPYRESAGIRILGTAADLNFEKFVLEYADSKSPRNWILIAPPSAQPVFDDVLMSWVPPYAGIFNLRLSVSDKAGNTRSVLSRIPWGTAGSVTDFAKSADVISPNGDGVQDVAELSFSVLEPVNLEFIIANESGYGVRTFRKSYPSPVKDRIVWDGRDGDGNRVPDGAYSITVAGLSFPVAVDTTMPEGDVQFGPLAYKKLLVTEKAINLYALARDANIREWVVEYGEGEDPQRWIEYQRGTGALSSEGSGATGPEGAANDAVLQTLTLDSIGWVKGKKLRITATDAGGNRSARVSDFAGEYVIVVSWDGMSVDDPDNSALRMFTPGVHRLTGAETLRRRVLASTVQYWHNGQWINGETVFDPAASRIDMLWDNRNLPYDIGEVRIRVVDEDGKEHYSNVIVNGGLFKINRTCSPRALTISNHLRERLARVELLAKAARDQQGAGWTIFTVADYTNVPRLDGEWSMKIPGAFVAGAEYAIKLVGHGENGTVYESNGLTYPWKCPGTELAVAYKEAECGQLSNRLVASYVVTNLTDSLVIQSDAADWSYRLKSVTLQAEGASKTTMLYQKEFVNNEKTFKIEHPIDTSALAEGAYTLVAELSVLDLQWQEPVEQKVTTRAAFNVDRTMPTAQLDFPQNGALLCLNPASDLPVKGVAVDNQLIENYRIFYSATSTAGTWAPATMKSGGNLIPIEGNRDTRGTLGTWNLSNATENELSLMLKVKDGVGNVSCSTVALSRDIGASIDNLNTDAPVFSPNADGVADSVQIGFSTSEEALIDVKVVNFVETGGGQTGPVVRTLALAKPHNGGSEIFAWDGRNDAGQIAADGTYAVIVSVRDSCGNVLEKRQLVDVDTTPPSVALTYPGPGALTETAVEVKGTAMDRHFSRYVLEAGKGENPAGWTQVALQTVPVSEGILGRWNTSGLDGTWTLRVSAQDTVGNKHEVMVTLALDARNALIKTLKAEPAVISPNSDARADATTASFELQESAAVRIDVKDENNAIKRTVLLTAPSPGIYSFVWDGKTDSGTVVPDGIYGIWLAATASSGTAGSQSEFVTVAVDTTAPVVEIRQPLNKSFVTTAEASIAGTISDMHLSEYSVSLVMGESSALLDRANQSRVNHTFGDLSALAEGDYALAIASSDAAGNENNKTISFTIDRTPPAVFFAAPKDGEVFGGERGMISVAGTVVERNPDSITLRYGAGDAPIQWTTLTTSATGTLPTQLYVWKVGNDDAVADGMYTLSLLATDKGGATAETKIKVTIDNTPPTAILSGPSNGDYIRGDVDITGTAFDQNPDSYTLELAQGACDAAYRWAVLKTATATVNNGTLFSWRAVPRDGNYCIRLTVADRAGGKAEAKASVVVDTTPPPAPAASGQVENKSDVHLTWAVSPVDDIAGYDVYRNGQKISTAAIAGRAFTDTNVSDGTYAYLVKAVDRAGWESAPSEAVNIIIDRAGPDGSITLPVNNGVVSGLVNIKGMVSSPADFKQYRVLACQGASPAGCQVLRTSTVPSSGGVLAQWETASMPDGAASVRLEAEDLSGNVNSVQTAVTVDNTPPPAPVLMSVGASGSSVSVSWSAVSATDLAGYLVFRNDLIVNGSGGALEDLSPYLIGALTYADSSLPDGTFTYSVVAMDRAGNLSTASNSRQVTIETHAPVARITKPGNGSSFEKPLQILAESNDIDIASVQFQYKSGAALVWTNLGGPVSVRSYSTTLDPAERGLTYGDYALRAIATDQAGKTDAAPAVISVTYTDLTPPAEPTDLTAATNGGTVTLAWHSNGEADLLGYNLYRAVENANTKVKINAVLLGADVHSFADQNVPDNTYAYQVTAVDLSGNESKPSPAAGASIFAPTIDHLPQFAAGPNITVTGVTRVPGAAVDVFLGADVAGTVIADSIGSYAFPMILSEGTHTITTRSRDSAGNVSKPSNPAVVIYNAAPKAPKEVVAAVQADQHSIQVTWSANSEPDLAGYYVYQNGVKKNGLVPITGGTASASSELTDWGWYYSYNTYDTAAKAIDNNEATAWIPAASDGQWLSLEWNLPALVTRVTITWLDARYAAANFQLQAWDGSAWTVLKNITGNIQRVNTLDLDSDCLAEKIRIYIPQAYDPYSGFPAGIAELTALKHDVITQTAFMSGNVAGGIYRYEVSAVDAYGAESTRTASETVAIGDVIPPSPPRGLAATGGQHSVTLQWTASLSGDATGYRVYRQSGEGWSRVNGDIVTALTYTQTNLVNAAYVYRVTALDAAGNESDPSNEASAIVAAAVPSPPSGVVVSAPAQGGVLRLAWNAGGAGTLGYHVYRGMTPGGPYTRVSQTMLPSSMRTYDDVSLVNGTSYYYVVAGMDDVGNRSDYSNEAFGTPTDLLPPAVPSLFLPAVPGVEIATAGATVAAAGTAEPGVSVELRRNGIPLGRVSALRDDVVISYAVSDIGQNIALSPLGTMIAYAKGGNINVRSLETGVDTARIDNASGPVWSPDGSRIAYTFDDPVSGKKRIAYYVLGTGEKVSLNSGSNAQELSPQWFVDGFRMAFILESGSERRLALKDLMDNTVTLLFDAAGLTSYRVSPDGTSVVFAGDSGLSIFDVTTAQANHVDSGGGMSGFDWSPDGTKLVYASSADGLMYIKNIAKNETIQVAERNGYTFKPVWTPAGDAIVYVFYDYWNENMTVRRIPAAGSGQPSVLYTPGYGVALLDVVPADAMLVVDQSTARISRQKGSFVFDAVGLDEGGNILVAAAVDEAGNASAPSEALSLTRKTGYAPDILAAEEDVFLYPPYPVNGELVDANIALRNISSMVVRNADVEVYVWNAHDEMELLSTGSIAEIAPGSAELVSVRWDSTGKTGRNRLVVVVDPLDKISESDETNNMIVRDIYVADQSGLGVQALPDLVSYRSDTPVQITATIWNGGVEKSVVLETRIEDRDGHPVAAFTADSVTLGYGTTEVRQYVWNTGATLAGQYRVRSELKDGSIVLASSSAEFTILPDVSLQATIATDKADYGPSENVVAAVTIKNNGKNSIIPAARIEVKYLYPDGAELSTTVQNASNLLPGTAASYGAAWNTATAPAGAYSVSVQAYLEDRLTATASAVFVVRSAPVITGSIQTLQPVIAYGSETTITYGLLNNGNADASGVTASIQLVDSETGTIVRSQEDVIDLSTASTWDNTLRISTSGMELKTYTVLLRCRKSSSVLNLASASFNVQDMTAPAIAAVLPTAYGSYRGTVPIEATASDAESGLERVEYRIDNGDWRLLPPTDPLHGRYSATWEPAMADSGAHTLDFRAYDKAGNFATALPTAFEVQLDAEPPVTTATVGTPKHETAGSIFITSGTPVELTATDDISGVARTEYRLDNEQYITYTTAITFSAEGTHTLEFRSVDRVGNVESTQAHGLTVDDSPPTTALTASDPLVDGVVNTISRSTFFTLTARDDLSGLRSTMYRIDDGPWQTYTGSFSLKDGSPGIHTIVFKSLDNVLNEELEKSVDVRLIILALQKAISSDSTVLVGVWADSSDKLQKDADIQVLDRVLASIGVVYRITQDLNEFTGELRSGRYNTYILIDVKESLLGREVRDAVYYGDGLIFIKTRHEVDPVLDELYGVKFTGRTTSENLTVALLDSPISAESSLESRGKDVVAEITDPNALVFARITDKQETYPAIVSRDYGRGKVVLYTFDLPESVDQVKIAALLINSINYVRPEEFYPRPLGMAPIRISVNNSAEPVGIKVRESLPPGSSLEAIQPTTQELDGILTWEKSLSPSETVNFRYSLKAPDGAADYDTRSEVWYRNGDEYRFYDRLELAIKVEGSSGTLLRDALSALNTTTAANEGEALAINKAINDLRSVNETGGDRKTVEQNIIAILNAIDEVKMLPPTQGEIRLQLDELLKIWERKWYELIP